MSQTEYQGKRCECTYSCTQVHEYIVFVVIVTYVESKYLSPENCSRNCMHCGTLKKAGVLCRTCVPLPVPDLPSLGTCQQQLQLLLRRWRPHSRPAYT